MVGSAELALLLGRTQADAARHDVAAGEVGVKELLDADAAMDPIPTVPDGAAAELG